MRVILHAGFHKTGTTTVQNTLRRNRPLLKRHLRVVLRPGMVPVCEAARAWSVDRDEMTLALLRYELAQLAEGWKADDPRPILVASEDLGGHMPGRRGLQAYDAAPHLMRTIAETLTEVHPDAEITFFFSTRAAAPWLASCHAQHLRAVRMTLDQDAYAARYAGSADLEGIVAEIETAVTPHPVFFEPLEQSRDRPLGPLDPLLRIAKTPPDLSRRIVTLPPANASLPAAARERLLALNRSDLDDAALRAAKQALYQEYS